MFDIITLGSATIDVLVKAKNEKLKHNHHTDIAYHLGEKILVDDIEFTTGGGGTNTAVAFSRLGLKTAFLGVISHDLNGEFIAKELVKENVEFLGVVKPGKPGYSVILPSSSDRTILSFKGINDQLNWEDVHPDSINTKFLYISSMLGNSFKTAERLAFYARKKE